MGVHNRVIRLRDVLEWGAEETLPEGTQVVVEGGQFVLRAPVDGQPWDDIVMVSPDGTLWTMTVDNTGAWTSTSFDALTTEAGLPLATESGDLLTPE